MRVFVAAEIGDALAGRAADLIARLRERAAAAAPGARITWLTASNLHITVTFIGEVDDARGKAVADALTPPLDVEPFDVVVEGAGAFPGTGAPRVLWAGVTRGADGLRAVERDVRARLTPLRVPVERRAYTPHLTLARVRDAAGLRTANLVEGLRETRLGAIRIDAITLFQSRLSPKGASYLPLLRTPLQTD